MHSKDWKVYFIKIDYVPKSEIARARARSFYEALAFASRSMQNTTSVDSAFPSKFRSFLDDVLFENVERRRKKDRSWYSNGSVLRTRRHAPHRHRAISLAERLCIRRTDYELEAS